MVRNKEENNNNEVSFPLTCSFFKFTPSFPAPLPPLHKQHRWMGNGSCDQSIKAPLCYSFLLTFFSCSSLGAPLACGQLASPQSSPQAVGESVLYHLEHLCLLMLLFLLLFLLQLSCDLSSQRSPSLSAPGHLHLLHLKLLKVRFYLSSFCLDH